MKLAAAAVLSSVLFSAAAFAQAGDATPPAGIDHGGPGRRHGGPMGEHRMPMGMMVAPITNAPFSAKYTLDTVHQGPGPDGAIQKYTATEAVYRDSLGRTREEVTLPARPPHAPRQNADATPATPALPAAPRTMTVIEDPVANTITRLMPDSKTAMVETVSANFFKHAVSRGEGGAAGRPAHVKADTAGANGGATPTTTDLGSKTFAGVVASGRRTVRTFPAHVTDTSAAAPRTFTRETWFSPDLKLEVSSTETGGPGSRSGVLTLLTRGEPDAALFKVPDGYTVKNAPPRMPGGMHHGGRGPGSPDSEQGTQPAPPSM